MSMSYVNPEIKTPITEKEMLIYTREYRPYYFVRHIFDYLFVHKELLENPEYKRLYDETLDFQVMHYCEWRCPDEKEYIDTAKTIEFLTGVEFGHKREGYEMFDGQTVAAFLGYRKRVWTEKHRFYTQNQANF